MVFPSTVSCDPIFSELKELMEIDLEGNPFKDKKIHKILEGGYFAALIFWDHSVWIHFERRNYDFPGMGERNHLFFFKTGPIFSVFNNAVPLLDLSTTDFFSKKDNQSLWFITMLPSMAVIFEFGLIRARGKFKLLAIPIPISPLFIPVLETSVLASTL